MTPESYVNAIIKKVKCSKNRRNEIKKQLLADINSRISQGETFQGITAQMGAPIEIAEDFNESIPKEEQKKYTQKKLLKIIVPAIATMAILAFLVYWLLPKGMDIEKSGYFTQAQVTEAMEETIGQINSSDYGALQANAIPQMQPYLTQEALSSAKSTIPGDWGEFRSFGKVYLAELVQSGVHFAVGEMNVSYENVTVTFRLTYDQNMKLAGIYIR
ncbi:hypothetical protein IMSAGC019_01302 [Lachnospiraceae bacterium]|nr:hypothetical protein IMSAGC019_01302 [Lachnospiraceae bacterium]